MNKEEIEELKNFTIDITDIDELALGLEVCSKKSNMVIQEFANLIIELQQENQQLKDRINKVFEMLEKERKGLKEKKRMIMEILTPENGYLKADIEYEIKRIEKYLILLKEDNKED